ncbi:MAG: pyridoxamine 5'-phosphate oxidase family protein [Candidatus Acetothermia bacterium]|nr:pyridoxamine 5'-phosphate oxidase family protein [Candidatus Acetothermia bacterium]MDH7505897.1 pyridoxamine 5'-phosphate oxidase family protein [Candidatus Acetothermia bacterium]
MADARERILKALRLGQPLLVGLATLTEDGKPWVRYVTAVASEDLALRLCTSMTSRKVSQIRRNPEVHLLCGVTDPERVEAYLQIQGRAEISTSKAERRAFWKDSLGEYFSGPDDPDYCVIIVRPYRIELYSSTRPEPEIWESGEQQAR